MRDPEEAFHDPASDDDIEDELLSSCRELSFGFTALDHLRWSSSIERDHPRPSRP